MSRRTTLIPKRIAQIRFSLMDPSEIRKMSSVEVKTPDTYKDDGRPYNQGLMDSHVGIHQSLVVWASIILVGIRSFDFHR